MLSHNQPQTTANTAPVYLTATNSKKVIVIGGPASGKSCLVHRAVDNTFTEEYQQTFGADLIVKHMIEDNKRSTLNIWCCGGHDRYKVLLDQFYQDVQGALLVFDLLNPKSFADCQFWYNEIKRLSPAAWIMLVGTKSDEADRIAVKIPDAMKQAADWGIPFKSVSAKTGRGIDEVFQELSAAIA
ncbi:P-loop containing nucleoside triphosphate hydrolase protein [Paraphysoderma sedebokerense]|nr:P-loop containing nucleoside triphosphate hydrolase protein [Paraphysoderma sedebokerense]